MTLSKLIIGFPRCGNQSHFQTYGTSSLEDLIYESDGVEQFKERYPGCTPMVLIRNNRWEHAYSNWSRMRKMAGEEREFKDCYAHYYDLADFDKYLKPWLIAYPDIEITTLEDLSKRPEFKHVDEFSIPHNHDDVKDFITSVGDRL